MSDVNSEAARAAELRATLARASTGMRRTWTWIAVAGLLAGTASVWYVRAQPRDTGPKYRTEQVQSGTLIVNVTATGEIQSLTEVNVGTEISGVVDRVLVDFNSPVAVGQLLATINTDKLRAQADQARAGLAASRARAQQAEATRAEGGRQLDRLLEVYSLSGGKVPSQQELDAQRAVVSRADADLASAAAQVQQSEASLAAIDTDLRRASIRSPIRGIVLDRQVDPGQTVAASFQTPTLFTLAEDLARMKLMVDVDEADIGSVRIGQAASFRVDAYPRRTFESAVTEVRSTPTKSNGVVTYQTVLTVDNSALLLKPGMTATADIVVESLANAVLVPNAALRFTPPVEASGGGSFLPGPPAAARVTTDAPATRVWTLVNGRATPVDVTVGASNGESTQVTGAVKPGDLVIVDVAAGQE